MNPVPRLNCFGLRPCFEQIVELSRDEVRKRLVEAFGQKVPGFEVHEFPDFIGLHIDETQRRFWSPRLFLVIDSADGGTTRIQGTYGPEIEVWSVFVYGYMILGLLAIFSGVLGTSQLIIHASPWGLWVLGAMAAGAGLLYLGSRLGMRLGASQTSLLHHTYESAIGRVTEGAAMSSAR
jgi:hypothetical protein